MVRYVSYFSHHFDSTPKKSNLEIYFGLQFEEIQSIKVGKAWGCEHKVAADHFAHIQEVEKDSCMLEFFNLSHSIPFI